MQKTCLCTINLLRGPKSPSVVFWGAYGVIERISFRHWTHLTDISDGVRVVRMVRSQAIPRHLTIAEVNVKVAYAGQQQVCDLCQGPATLRVPAPFRWDLEGHFSRDCPEMNGYRDRDAVSAVPDPTPAEAAGHAAANAHADLPVTEVPPCRC